ncbi:MAG: hypothetical protein QXG39_02995 [Candidatus Aenigmatarchaeota archaeon]
MLAQVSLEFITLLSLLSIFLLLLIYQGFGLQNKLSYNKILMGAQAISDQVASEINLALKAGDGYSRFFTIPPKILNLIDYTIEVKDYNIIVSWDGNYVKSSILTRSIYGQILKGNNFIKNVDGLIYVNT